jgi:hypothetical protein
MLGVNQPLADAKDLLPQPASLAELTPGRRGLDANKSVVGVGLMGCHQRGGDALLQSILGGQQS